MMEKEREEIFREYLRKAGRKGAKRLLEKYGREHFQRLGKRGGARNREKGAEYFREIARKRWQKEKGQE